MKKLGPPEVTFAVGKDKVTPFASLPKKDQDEFLREAPRVYSLFFHVQKLEDASAKRGRSSHRNITCECVSLI